MEVEIYDQDAHFDLLVQWYLARGEPAPITKLIPKLTVLAKDSAGYIASISCYQDNSTCVCWFDWFIANPERTHSAIARGSRVILDFLLGYLPGAGYNLCLANVADPRLIKQLERRGFFVTQSHTQILAKPVS
jgi:hypothetical protein